MICEHCNDTGYRTRTVRASLDDSVLPSFDDRYPCDCSAGLKVIGLRVLRHQIDAAWYSQLQLQLCVQTESRTGYPAGDDEYRRLRLGQPYSYWHTEAA